MTNKTGVKAQVTATDVQTTAIDRMGLEASERIHLLSLKAHLQVQVALKTLSMAVQSAAAANTPK